MIDNLMSLLLEAARLSSAFSVVRCNDETLVETFSKCGGEEYLLQTPLEHSRLEAGILLALEAELPANKQPAFQRAQTSFEAALLFYLSFKTARADALKRQS